MNKLEDESDLIQYGQSVSEEFYFLKPGNTQSGGYSDDLSVNAKGTYAFADTYFVPNEKVLIESRQTYSLLEWLGDIGGLNDILFLIAEQFITSYQGFFQANLILTSLFRSRNKSAMNQKQKPLHKSD